MKIREIRKAFIEYFEKNDHMHIPSASLIPTNDPTLLFTTAGMVPFKEYFAGVANPPSRRLASIQKCIRTTDLEQTGKTKRHLSFFEMLGNFSFGDYFKKEAIQFAWEFSTQVLGFEKDRIHISIHESDDEAMEIWKNYIGVHESHIVRLGDEDNFWGPAGDTGACGPSSELYLDRGEEFGKDCRVGDDCERFMEYWNLVFNQFFKNDKGKFLPLKQTGIDTGAGLERIASLLQNVDSVYDTDELKNLRDRVASLYQKNYDQEMITPIRVVTDHIRTLSFSMADGIFPSNESRGYILRRILRRALLFGRKMGQKNPLLYKLIPEVTRIYGEFYPELKEHETTTIQFIENEEKRFLSTLEAGSEKLELIINEAKQDKQIVSGKNIFMLYDTFGFPPEMTLELCEQNQIHVDMEGFEREMEKQRERGKAAWKGASASLPLETNLPATEFIGYDHNEGKAKILGLYSQDKKLESIDEKNNKENGPFYMVVDQTPFYGESGGQIGDSGSLIYGSNSARIIDTQKMGHFHVHILEDIEGNIKVGDEINLKIDLKKREKLRKNHSATHLLNASLRNVLGGHVKQSGSLVDSEYFRFDFTHPKAVSKEEISKIEERVNRDIFASLEVDTNVLPIEEAKNTGALMTFGEKYGEIVRVIHMGRGDEKASIEFCGGTHVKNTSDIGFFLIAKESSPGAGNRRIEALVHLRALDFFLEKINELLERMKHFEKDLDSISEENYKKWVLELNQIKKDLSFSSESIRFWQRFKELEELWNTLETKIKKEKKKKKKENVKVDTKMIDDVLKSNDRVVVTFFEHYTMDYLKSAVDILREKDKEKIFLLTSFSDAKWFMVAASSKKFAENSGLDIPSIFKNVSREIQLNGGGGGRPEFLQASGPFKSDDEKNIIEEKIKKFAQKIIL